MTLLVRNIGNKLSDPVPASQSLASTNNKLIDKDRLTRLVAADEKMCVSLVAGGSWWAK